MSFSSIIKVDFSGTSYTSGDTFTVQGANNTAVNGITFSQLNSTGAGYTYLHTNSETTFTVTSQTGVCAGQVVGTLNISAPATATPTPTAAPATATPTPTGEPATATPTPTGEPATATPTPTGEPATATPTPTATLVCEILSNIGVGFTSLGEDETDACSQIILNQFGSDSTSLTSATVIYSSTTCTSLANPGHYAQGGSWRYWNGNAFTDSGLCPTPPPPTATPTPTPTPTAAPPTATPTPTAAPATATPTPTGTPVTTWYRFSNCTTSLLVWQELGSEPIESSRWFDGNDYYVYTNLPTTTEPSPLVNNLTYLNGLTDCPAAPTLTPAPTPTLNVESSNNNICTEGTGFINLTASGGSGNFVWHIGTTPANSPAEASDTQTASNLPNSTYFVAVFDITYGTSDSDQVIIDCTSAPTPSPTPSPTPTPTPVVYTFGMAYSTVSESDACGISTPNTTVYTTCALLTTGCVLYSNSGLSSFASDGWYHNTSNGAYYYVEGNGTIIEEGICTTPTPTPQPSSTPPPCTAIDMQTTGSGTSAGACSNGTSGSRRRHDGALPAPGIGDTIFTNITCTLTFDGGGLWYFVAQDTSAIQVGPTGVVIDKTIC